MDILLACDVGTSALKLTAIDLSPNTSGKRIVGHASRAYPTRYAAAGHAEQDPHDWLLALIGSVRELGERTSLSSVHGLVFTGQMSAALLVDEAGEPTHPALIWSDQRAVAEVGRAAESIDEAAFYRITGNRLNATYTGPKLAWLARHTPEAFARAKTFLQPKDWLIARLTGAMAMDASDASCTGLFDLATGEWSDRLLDLFGVPGPMAPRLAEAATVAGSLSQRMATELGLLQGLPVILGGGDGPTTALGVGIGGGEAYLSLGTSAWISFLSDAPVDDAQHRLFSFRHVLPGRFAITGSTQNAGGALGWLLGDILQSKNPEREIAAALQARPPGADGLLVLPYLQGERTPVWDSMASGAVLGLRSHHTRADIVRAFIEGIGHQLRLIVETFEDCGYTGTSMAVVGGLCGNPHILAMMAAITQRRLVRPAAYAEVTALGAGILGALALGVIARPEEARDWRGTEQAIEPGAPDAMAEQRFARFEALYRNLKPLTDTGYSI